jgi:hypothetical protein
VTSAESSGVSRGPFRPLTYGRGYPLDVDVESPASASLPVRLPVKQAPPAKEVIPGELQPIVFRTVPPRRDGHLDDEAHLVRVAELAGSGECVPTQSPAQTPQCPSAEHSIPTAASMPAGQCTVRCSGSQDGLSTRNATPQGRAKGLAFRGDSRPEEDRAPGRYATHRRCLSSTNHAQHGCRFARYDAL